MGFRSSDRGGERAAAIYTLIETCKLCGVDARAWLADVLSRLPDHASRIKDPLPWRRDDQDGFRLAAVTAREVA